MDGLAFGPIIVALLTGGAAVALLRLIGRVVMQLLRGYLPPARKPTSVLEEYQALVDQLQEQIDRLTTRVGQLETNETRLRQELMLARNRIDELERENRQLKRQVNGGGL